MSQLEAYSTCQEKADIAEENLEFLDNEISEDQIKKIDLKNNEQTNADQNIIVFNREVFCCELCNKRFGTDRGLRRHCMHSHSKEILLYDCYKCGGKFRSATLYKRHKCRKKNVLVPNVKVQENFDNQETYSYKDIDRFYNKHDIGISNVFFCKICTLQLKSRASLRFHLFFKHICPSKIKKCPDCGSKYKNKTFFLAHLKSSKCWKSQENKQLSQQNSVKKQNSNHLRSITESDLMQEKELFADEVKEMHKCTKCSIFFFDQRKLKEHILDDQCNLEEKINSTKKEYLNTLKILKEAKLKELRLKRKLIELGELEKSSCESENNNDVEHISIDLESHCSEDTRSTIDLKNSLKSNDFDKRNNRNGKNIDITKIGEEKQKYYLNEVEAEFENQYYRETKDSDNQLLRETESVHTKDTSNYGISNHYLEESSDNSQNKEAETYSIDVIEEPILEEWIEDEQDACNFLDNIKNRESSIKMKIETDVDSCHSTEKYNEEFIGFLRESKVKEEQQINSTQYEEDISNNFSSSNNYFLSKSDHENVDKNLQKSKNSLNSVLTKGDIFQCTYCDKILKNKCRLKAHIRTHRGDQIYKCSYCNHDCFDRTSFKIHERRHINDRRYKCEFCVEKFVTIYEKNRHQKIWHGNGTIKELENKKVGGYRNSMSYDDKKKYSPKALLGEDGLYHCKMCEKVCLTAKTMRKHTALHLNGKPCPKCSKVFAYESQLQRHLQVPHEEKNFMCTVCGNRYVSASSLLTHSKVHSEQAIKCPICLKVFGTLYNLDRHMIHKHKLKSWQDVYTDITVEKLEEE